MKLFKMKKQNTEIAISTSNLYVSMNIVYMDMVPVKAPGLNSFYFENRKPIETKPDKFVVCIFMDNHNRLKFQLSPDTLITYFMTMSVTNATTQPKSVTNSLIVHY